MKIALTSFRGEAPRVTPRALPENAAQEATNCRLQTGDLESWRQFLLTKTLANPAAVQTIYLLNGAWLSWTAQVDVARGLIAGDDTFRTYLTCPALYAQPRFTTYALATTGAEPFPVATRPLGVPGPDTAPAPVAGVDPNPLTFSIDTLDAGDVLATSWVANSPSTGGTYYTATQGAGVYLLTYDENRDPGSEAHAYRNFGIKGSAVIEVSADFKFTGDAGNAQACLNVACDVLGSGIRVLYNDGATAIFKATAWGAIYHCAALVTGTISPPLSAGVVYTLRVNATLNVDGTKTVTARFFNGATELATLTTSNTFDDGDHVGIANGINEDAATQFRTEYDNIHVTASGPTNYVAVNTATSYVYTFVNDLGEQSPPGPPSVTVLRPDGVKVTVTTPTTLPPGLDPDYSLYGILTKRLYRAVTGASGTIFVLLTELPLAQAAFEDTLDDSAIADNDVLESDEWDLPPDDLQGILALPNGIMCGFWRNLLCFSAAGRPHAWPVRYRLPTDTDIVAIANIDNTVVIGTKSFVYTATGNDPASYSMSKPGDAQACVAKRSMVFMPDQGVVYASPDGWMVCAGSAGQVRNATEGIFTQRQWKALNPASIISAVHDGVLFFFCDPVGAAVPTGYALDTRSSGAGLVRLSCHAIATHVDPLTDALYLVLDRNDEPTDADLPLASTAVVADDRKIFAFDAGASDMVYRWRGKLNLSPYPLALAIAQVRALDYANVLWRIYGSDGALLYERVLASEREFVLPLPGAQGSHEMEFVGTSTVRTAQAAEDVMELG